MKKYNFKKLMTSIVVATGVILSMGISAIGATRESGWIDSPASQL